MVILFAPDDDDDFRSANALAEKINLLAIELSGTVSGEHGIGIGKQKYMSTEHGAAYNLMRGIKKAIDPDNIMNPGKLLGLK